MVRKKETDLVRCADCHNAKLIKYTGDPLIAECTVNHERQVASTQLYCTAFVRRSRPPQVEHRKKRLAITDLWI